MTSFPSPPPIGALRMLLPLPGRGDGGQGPGFPALGQLLNGLDADLGPGPRHADSRGEGRQGPLAAYIRSDGSTPLSPGDAARLADTFSHALRQAPSHPLYRELQQLPAESVRQLLQFVAQHAPAGREVPSHIGESLIQASRGNAEARPAEPRALAEAARAQAASTAQGSAERAAGQPREAVAAPLAGRGAEDVRGPSSPGAPVLRAMTEAAAQSPVLQRSAAEAALAGSAMTGAAVRDPGAAARAADVPGNSASPAPSGSTAAAGLPAELAVQQALHARLPGEALVPGRADGGPGGGDPGGLTGLAGAAGVTLAAVGQPAGTTFAHAPTLLPRARRDDKAADATRPQQDETVAARDEGDGQQHADGRRRGHSGADAGPAGQGAGERGPAAAARADAAAAAGTAATPTVPGTATASAASAKAAAAAAAAGHTVAAGPPAQRSAARPAQPAARDAQNPEPPRAARPRPTAPAAHADPGDRAAVPGQIGPGPADPQHQDDPRLRRLQWLFWSLIAVTYACLGVALATLAPGLVELPVSEESRLAWRNGLTTLGLVTGLAAWMLARRLR